MLKIRLIKLQSHGRVLRLHHEQQTEGFTKRYNLTQLVYCEVHQSLYEAISREKRLKKWNRAWKIILIEKNNPDWEDLYEQIV